MLTPKIYSFDQLNTVSTSHQLPPAQICIPPPAERTTTIQPDDPPAQICTPLPAERAMMTRPNDIWKALTRPVDVGSYATGVHDSCGVDGAIMHIPVTDPDDETDDHNDCPDYETLFFLTFLTFGLVS